MKKQVSNSVRAQGAARQSSFTRFASLVGMLSASLYLLPVGPGHEWTWTVRYIRLMRLASGIHLGTYEIVAPLGAGGTGEVYRARDTKLRREVALKVLPADVSANPERLARFGRLASGPVSLRLAAEPHFR